MRICLLYDCLFPWTVGGAERWYRALGERLAQDGHEVTYLTLRQWEDNDAPEIAGIDIIPVGPRMELYADGKRRIAPPLRFGWGVFWHLLRHGGRYDHVHTASFPYFSLLAAGVLKPFKRYSLGVDWHEVWSREYWRGYLGAAGAIGWWVQRLCAAVPQLAFAFSRLHLGRLEKLGRQGTLLPGEYAGGDRAHRPLSDKPTIMYAGRLIAEKRVDLLIEAFALALKERPDLRLRILGQGPERERLAELIDRLDIGDAAELCGFVEEEQLDRWMGEAIAICQPSEREGYGMVVVEAAVRGVPAIVVEGDDNAAVELIDPGENGIVSLADPQALAEALLAIAREPEAWRERSKGWYARNRERLSLENSLAIVSEAIAD